MGRARRAPVLAAAEAGRDAAVVLEGPDAKSDRVARSAAEAVIIEVGGRAVNRCASSPASGSRTTRRSVSAVRPSRRDAPGLEGGEMRTRRSLTLVLAGLLALGGCASSQSPVLYPNAKLKQAGREQADREITECRKLADAYVQSTAGKDVAKGAAVGGAAGAASLAGASAGRGRGGGTRAAVRGAAGAKGGRRPSPVPKAAPSPALDGLPQRVPRR